MKRHGTDTISLIAGLFLVTLSAVWLVDAHHTLTQQAIGLIFAGVFVIAGCIGIIRAIRRPRSEQPDDSVWPKT